MKKKINQHSYITTGSLEKFLRYLRYLLRSEEKVESSYLGVFMSIMIVYFSFLVDRFFPEGAVNNLICIALFLWFLYYLLKAFTEDSKRLLLYEDYIEVIEGILESRKKSEDNQM